MSHSSHAHKGDRGIGNALEDVIFFEGELKGHLLGTKRVLGPELTYMLFHFIFTNAAMQKLICILNGKK